MYCFFLFSVTLQRTVFEKAVTKYGKLDIVVNNAGVVDEKNWHKAVDINLVRICVPCMKVNYKILAVSSDPGNIFRY